MGSLSQNVSGGPFQSHFDPFDPADPNAPADGIVRRSVIVRGYGWYLAAGLMGGIVQSHAVQPIAAWSGALPWNAKYWVSLAGAVLYSVCLVLLLLRHRAGLWIAVVGPLVGLAAVTTGVVLAHLGVISGFRGFDAFQLSGGVLQVAALAIAVVLLRRRS